MAKRRDAEGNLQPNAMRFPYGVAPVAARIHALGLKFGIYEDAGSKTCGGFAGSGKSRIGGQYHFAEDIRLFENWGVDYLKLDGCNVLRKKSETKEHAYHEAYAAASAAIRASAHRVELLESAPAYFQGTPLYYHVLSWVGQYGQLWRTGTDIRVFHRAHPNASRFDSVKWNYAYNLMIGRYQKPGNWDDPDFIIGGADGMDLAETRSQMALWSMMSAPLILSLNVAKLSPAAIRVLGNREVIAVDQSRLGQMSTLVRRTPYSDILIKSLGDGAYAAAVFNRHNSVIDVRIPLASLGWSSDRGCSVSLRNLWTGTSSTVHGALDSKVAPHDTLIWSVHPTPDCGLRSRTGAILMAVWPRHDSEPWRYPPSVESYGRCLASIGVVRQCEGNAEELWTITRQGAIRSHGECIDAVKGSPEMRHCNGLPEQQWIYRRSGNLVNVSDKYCLAVAGPSSRPMHWMLQRCGDDLSTQIWSLPN
jgi:alpha-galactosidase